MIPFYEIMRFFALSQLLLIVILVLRSDIRRQDAYTTSFFCSCVIAYLLCDYLNAPGNWVYTGLLLLNFSLPVAFWLFSKALFNDEFKPKIWLAPIFIFVIATNYFTYHTLHSVEIGETSTLATSLRLLLYSVVLFFVGLGLYEAAKDRENDLIPSRIRFRNMFMLAVAGLIILTVLSELAFAQFSTPLPIQTLHKTAIFFLTFFFLINILRIETSFFRIDKPIETASSSSDHSVDPKQVKALLNLMEERKIYHTEGLSIGQLADILEMKEYRLRQMINQHLGFRNFNAFLNSYRIQEACDILSNPLQNDKTILEIAYAMGYQSLAPFNKAFKNVTDMTPTEWRKEKQ